jgi:hypothetical protein
MGRRLGVTVRAVLVEADAGHLAFIHEAVRDSGTPLSQVNQTRKGVRGEE